MKPEQFRQAVENAEPGEQIICHMGDSLVYCECADDAWRAHVSGKVLLTQRKLRPFMFDYIATRSRR